MNMPGARSRAEGEKGLRSPGIDSGQEGWPLDYSPGAHDREGSQVGVQEGGPDPKHEPRVTLGNNQIGT
jgi:hypothetical protein